MSVRRAAVQHFLAREALLWRVVILKVHLVQQVTLAYNYKASEFRKPYLKSGNSSKTAYSCNAEFMVSFVHYCQIIYVRASTFLPNRVHTFMPILFC